MGRVIAMGGGFGDEDEVKLAKYIMELTGKSTPNYLQIPTAGYDFADKESFAFYSKMGCDAQMLYLTHAYMTEEIVAQQIRNADMIYVPGGNLKFLMDTWRKTHADKYLREAFDLNKVLFGTSSGSMCWFSRGYDDCGPESSFMFVDALGLFPYCNVPHYENKNWQSFNACANQAGLSSICCENETAIANIDGKWQVMVASERPDGRVWFFDAQEGYKRYDLCSHSEILERL